MSSNSIQKTNLLYSDKSLNTGINPQGSLTASPLETLQLHGSSSSLTFIDASVSQIGTLIAGMMPGTEVHILKSSEDAITQITETLLHRQGISSLNIISHGSAGSLDFASNSLNAYNIRSYTQQLQSWGNALTENADILLFGCNVAENALGKAFVEIMRQVTGADVAASSNLTGSFAKGGDWELEYKAGSIEASSVITSRGAAQYKDTLMTPSLVANLNPRTANPGPMSNSGSNPANLININNILFFTANDGMGGTELWRLDPGSSSPVLFREINTRSGLGSNPSNLTNVNNILYFTADDGVNGAALWRIDPISSNSLSRISISTANNSLGYNPSNLININGTLYFTADDGSGTELWRINTSTATMPSPVRFDLNTRPGVGSNPSNLVNVNNVLYFTANDGISGTELWRLDTLNNPNPTRVTEVRLGEAGSNPANLTNVNGILYFTADNGNSGTELWRLDSTGNPVLLDINTRAGTGSNPANLTNVNGILYFTADEGSGVNDLMQIDATGKAIFVSPANTTTSFPQNPANLTNVNGTLYFTATTNSAGTELWRLDTSGKAVQVQDIYSGAVGSNPSNLTNINGILYFTTNDGRLWFVPPPINNNFSTPVQISTSTTSSRPVFNSAPLNLTNINGNLYFAYDDGFIGSELWRIGLSPTTGAPSTSSSLVRDIRTTSNPHSNPSNITNVDGTIYFTADDAIRGVKLWQLDASGNPVIVLENNNILNPSNLTNVNGTLYFTGNEPMNGSELWRLEAGGSPVRVVGIRSGSGGYNPSNLTNLNGMLFFTANDGMYGSDLWVIDRQNGNPTKISLGTNQVVPNTSNLISIGNSLFFTANNGNDGTELWRLTPGSGTVFGTPTLINIRNRDAGGSNPSNLTDVNGILFFTADDGVGGRELWQLNLGSTTPISINIRTGAAGSNPSNLTNINGRLYFSADDGIGGTEIWYVDVVSGNPGSPVRVEVRSGTTGSNPSNFTGVNETLYFTANSGRGMEVFRLNNNGSFSPVNASGSMNPSVLNPSNLFSLGDSLFFSGFQETVGRELWRVDSSGNLSLVRNIHDTGSSDPSNFVNIDGTVYFAADNGIHGKELWRLDADGNTAMVGNIRGNIGIGSNPSNFIDVNGILYFTADDGNSGTELWRISGQNGTPTLVRNINSSSASNFGISYGISSNPSHLSNVNGTLYFTADDGTAGRELWRIDTMGNAVLVRDLNTSMTRAGSNPSNLTNVNGTLYFTANNGSTGTELWRIDATGNPVMVRDINSRSGFGSNPLQLTIVNGILYFTADVGSGDRELWRIDGTGNAVLVRDINTGYNINLNSGVGSDPSQLTNVNGVLYFTANDGASGGRELWRIDGTGNAVLVRDINTRTFGASSNPSQLTNINGVLYFTADDGLSGTELWRIDGTGITARVRDINTNVGIGSNPSNLTNVNGTLYFTANDGVNGRELWRIDSMGNAVLATDINRTTGASSNPSNLTVVNNILYFVAEDIGGNRELWRIDPNGMMPPVRLEIQPGSFGSHPSQLTNFNGTLYFTAEDRIGNVELWRINKSGNPELVQDITPGLMGSNASSLFSTSSALYFTASDGSRGTGTELWRIENLPPGLSTVNKSGNEDSTISFTAADFASRFNDPEGNPLTQIRVVSLPTNGTLRLGNNNVVAGQEIPVADIGFLTFAPSANFNGSVSFSWNGSDGSRYSMGNSAVSITVNPVNDLPTVTSVSKSGDEDRVIRFALSDFSSKFTDVDGNALNRIRITSLPSNGKLMLGATDVTLNQEIAAAEITNLNYVPNANFSGTVSFAWNGFDGTAYATANSTVSITVNPTPEWQIAATADFTGDGKQDILQRDPSNGAYRLWYLDANNTNQTVALPTMGSNLAITSIANFDGNASKDIFWQSTTGENRIWRMGTAGAEVVNLPTVNPNNVTVQHVGDFDGDGDADILLRDKTDGMIAIWESNPSNLDFIRGIVLSYVADNNTQIKQVSDLDGDGDLDILWYNAVSGAVSTWEMQGTSLKGGFELSTVSDTNTKIQLVADFDGDNDMDILWYNETNGLTAIWEMNGVNIKQGNLLGYVGDTNTKIRQIVDFDGDKDLDILWYNDTTGFMAIWEMNGINLKQGIVLADSGFGDTKIKQIADFDGDKDLDFLWYNDTTGFTAIWEMNGVNLKQGIGLSTVSDTNTKISQIADFDDDNDLDILWHNQTTGFAAIWSMNGVNIGQGVILPTIDTSFKINVVGDFNGDGKLDIVWYNSTSSATKVWLTDGANLLDDVLLPV